MCVFVKCSRICFWMLLYCKLSVCTYFWTVSKFTRILQESRNTITYYLQAILYPLYVHKAFSRWCANRKTALFYIPYLFHSAIGSLKFSSLNIIEQKCEKSPRNERKKSLSPIHVRILGRFVFSDDWNLFRKFRQGNLCSLYLALCNNACEFHSSSWKFSIFLIIFETITVPLWYCVACVSMWWLGWQNLNILPKRI